MNNNDIIKLEEALVATGLYGKISAQHLDEATWPQKLEDMLSRMEKGKTVQDLSASELINLSEHLYVNHRMDAAHEAVPEALMATVERALAAEAGPEREGIVVRLLRNGMELIHGGLAGATLELAPITATRRSSPAEAPSENPTGSRIDLSLPVGRGQLHCSILQTSASEAMVSLSLKNLAGSYQLSLRKDGRLVGSHSGVKSDRSVQFDRIMPGSYSVELKGASNVEIPFSIV
ncbi:MAG TPA: hypothetical protein DEA96_09810 [Leptospiraceae bacterium]|nr:hypothetical protein [Spirochaetaceae bacterium]HBS05250.1 hypothetical protein [Leptospiraceae bacterium]|tara:strand:- start:5011 stop:5712 length:702 start_codon:yes stop_codon:yes gene_type:complete